MDFLKNLPNFAVLKTLKYASDDITEVLGDLTKTVLIAFPTGTDMKSTALFRYSVTEKPVMAKSTLP